MFIAVGSSPLARGTRCRTRLGCAHARLIPARAGNTSRLSRRGARPPAHPRSRGEHNAGCIAVFFDRGSSPLARGTLRRIRHVYRHIRLIPARAGNTTHTHIHTLTRAAHPRSRGEHSPSQRVSSPSCGSSPFARGTLAHVYVEATPRRLIPARAGNTRPHVHGRRLRAAHPRSRGEHIHLPGFLGFASGSSPLARGTHVLARRRNRGYRLIPARAGNTAAERHPRRR